MELSNRAKALTTASTIAISSKAKELKEAGYDVISLGFGEPDFNTPEYIIQAAKDAMDEGKTKYTPADGIPELKQIIIDKYQKEQGLVYNLDGVIVTAGAKLALYLLFQIVLNEGDEVIIPTPYWVSYPDQVTLAGGKAVFVECQEENDFKLTLEQLEAVVTSKTKVLVLNSPNNPTGTVYSREELLVIGEYCVKNNMLIVFDEIYEKLIYTSDEHRCMAALSEAIKQQTILVNGLSKSHAMTGWRIGYAIGPERIIRAMASLASHATSNPTSISQYAALKAYEQEENEVDVMRDVFAERLNSFYDSLMEVPHISCIKPKGAFYLFPNVKKTAESNGFDNVDDWVKALLEEEKVALVPGSGFGAPDFVRLSYATSLEELLEAAKRIKRFVMKHQVVYEKI